MQSTWVWKSRSKKEIRSWLKFTFYPSWARFGAVAAVTAYHHEQIDLFQVDVFLTQGMLIIFITAVCQHAHFV